jgi:hypothetical protein
MSSYPAQYFGSATAIVNQTNVGVNSLSAQINSAGGGGGGGGGSNYPSNILASSITFPNGQVNLNTGINFSTILAINGQSSSNATDFYFISPTTLSLFGGNPTNTFQVNAPSGNGAILTINALDNSNSAIIAQDTGNVPQPLSLIGSGVFISSLNVSSINGQLPSGGGGVDPNGISTNKVTPYSGTGLNLIIDSSTGIAMDSTKGGVVNITAGSGAGTIGLIAGAISTPPDCDLIISSINGATPAGGGVNPDGISTNQIAVSSGNALRFTVTGTDEIGINSDAGGSIILNSQGGSGAISILGRSIQTSTDCDLSISSINGQLPVGSIPANIITSSISTSDPTSVDLSIVGASGGAISFNQSSDQGIVFQNGTFAEIRNTGSLVRIGGQEGQTETSVSISSLTVSSINGNVPALTSGQVLDIATLFNNLFTANPLLSTIIY